MNKPFTASESIETGKFQERIKKYAGKFLLSVFTAIFLTGCASGPPSDPENVCNVFDERRDWWRAAKSMNDKYDVPIHVPMAIMFQESSFQSRAKPPRRKLLGFIPWKRQSDAFGYAQVKTATWEDYVNDTGYSRARRDNFADAIDFVGWYVTRTHRMNGVSKWDAYGQYLNYHEGWGGYQRQTYLQKQWLVQVARNVDSRSNRYASQLRECENKLNRGWFRRLLFG